MGNHSNNFSLAAGCIVESWGIDQGDRPVVDCTLYSADLLCARIEVIPNG